MPPTIITDPAETVSEFPLATIETKDSLEDEEWTATTYLWVNKLTRAVNAYDEAEIERYIGDLVQPGTDFYAAYPPLDLLGKFVRITIPQTSPLTDIVWVGYIIGTAHERAAVKDAPGPTKVLTGRNQVLTAVGLEYFLDRVQIDSAYIYETTKINRSIPFNGGRGVALDPDTRTRANRSAATNADGVYTFVPNDETGQLWKLGNIVNYLLQYFTTRNKAGDVAPVTYVLDAQDQLDAVLDGVAPTLDVDALTVFQVLNKLLSPQRGFVWWAEWFENELGYKVNIRVETLATSAITLPSTGTIPANRDQQSLDFDGERDVENVITAEVGSRIYHQIICRGARMTSTCTLGNVDSETITELIHDWADTPVDMQAGYNHAAADTTGYDALAEDEQAKRNDAFREAETWYRVYTAFRVSPDWDGKSGDGKAATRDWTFPQLSATGTIEGSLVFNVNGLRLLNHTRLKRGWNYADTASIVETTPAETEAEYMPLFAIMQVATGTSDKYQFVEKMNEHDFVEGDLVSAKISTSYSVRTQQNVPGVLVTGHGSQHACALNHWSGAEPTANDPQVDYETLRVTATLEADTYCEARYPEDADLPASVPLQKLLLYVGDEYRLDFLAANTVVDLNNGDLVTTNGGLLRDDRKHLQDVARAAYEWYKLDRRPIKVTFRQLRNLWRLGMLITTIGSGSVQTNVNTVASMITYDCQRGTTLVETHDSALDITKVA